MVEYIYDAIRANKDSDVRINAYITDKNDDLITENCHIAIYDGTKLILNKNGEYMPDFVCWEFLLTTEELKGMSGRYLYSIYHDDEAISFKQPIYFV